MNCRINKKHFLGVIIIGIIQFFSFLPAYLNYTFLTKYDILANLFTASFMVFYLFYYQKIKNCYLWIGIYLTTQFFSTILNHGQIASALWGNGVLLLAMCIGMQWSYKNNEKLFLQVTYFLFYSLIIINFISLLLFPKGMYKDMREIEDTNYFLGNYNVFIIYIFPAIIIGYLYVKKFLTQVPAHYIFLWVISLITVIMKKSVTSIAGLGLLLSYLCFFNHRLFHLFLNIKTYLIANGIFFHFFVWNTSDNWLMKKIAGLLGKDITFTGRTIIWRNAKTYIAQHLFLGNGLENPEILSDKLGLYAKRTRVAHTHNLIIDILYKTGILGLAAFAILFILLLLKLRQLKDTQTRYFLEAFLGIFLLMSQFEAYNFKFIFFMMTTLYLYACKNQKPRAGAAV